MSDQEQRNNLLGGEELWGIRFFGVAGLHLKLRSRCVHLSFLSLQILEYSERTKPAREALEGVFAVLYLLFSA
jgi:hypothetical protein